MTENVYNIAQSHYAGDLVITSYDRGFSNKSRILGNNTEIITDIVNESKLNPSRIVYRTLIGNNGVVYFNGAAVRLKYCIGVDWENEYDYFDNVTYAAAPAEPLTGENTIVISAPVAEQLSLQLGDSVILEVPTAEGYKNTGVFIVGAIINDATIFGYYKVYLPRETLNLLVGFDENACTSVGLFFADRGDMTGKEQVLQAALSGKLDMGPLVANRDELDLEVKKPWEGLKYFILTIPVYLSEVGELLDALDIITYFLYIVMLLIIFVSATVTYRLILHERTKEIGTMRALGFYGSDIRIILIMETVCLGLVSLAAGFILASVAGYALSFMKFTSIPSFEIFTKDGRLFPLYLLSTVGTNVLAVFCILFPAVWFPVYKSSRSPLPDMLAGGMKS